LRRLTRPALKLVKHLKTRATRNRVKSQLGLGW